jgi:hypothetical protein
VQRVNNRQVCFAKSKIILHFVRFFIVKDTNKKIILNCTTYFREDFSVTDFIENFSTIFKNEPKASQCEILIINEYSKDNTVNLAFNFRLIKQEFPNAIFIQKRESEFGQAKSLNHILNAIKQYDYQIQWEEGWVCKAAFIEAATLLLDTSSINQVGITSDWQNTSLIQQPKQIEHSMHKYRELIADPSLYELKPYLSQLNNYRYISELLGKVDINIWPLYSLRPCVNKVSFLNTLPPFPAHACLWPVRFEYIYALCWLLSGGEKAMLDIPTAFRSQNKKSTYRQS